MDNRHGAKDAQQNFRKLICEAGCCNTNYLGSYCYVDHCDECRSEYKAYLNTKHYHPKRLRDQQNLEIERFKAKLHERDQHLEIDGHKKFLIQQEQVLTKHLCKDLSKLVESYLYVESWFSDEGWFMFVHPSELDPDEYRPDAVEVDAYRVSFSVDGRISWIEYFSTCEYYGEIFGAEPYWPKDPKDHEKFLEYTFDYLVAAPTEDDKQTQLFVDVAKNFHHMCQQSCCEAEYINVYYKESKFSEVKKDTNSSVFLWGWNA